MDVSHPPLIIFSKLSTNLIDVSGIVNVLLFMKTSNVYFLETR